MYEYNVRFCGAGLVFGPKEYFYLAFTPYKVGDVVVVDTARGPAVAQITSTPDIVPDIEPSRLRTIICKIDILPWMEREALRPGNPNWS